MSKVANGLSTESLTFFEPLKDENPLSRSNVFQSVLGLFRKDSSTSPFSVSPIKVRKSNSLPLKKETKSRDELNISAIDNTEAHSSTQINGNQSFYAPNLNLNLGVRPDTLGITPLYKTRELLHGSEVELRLKNFSTMFRDLPKMISGNNEHIKEAALSVASSSASSSGERNMRQYWMADEHCHECYDCGDQFTTFRRRHHCRSCGHIFCKRCCYRLVPGHVIGFANRGMQRTCTYCYNNLLSKHDISLTNSKAIGPQLLLTDLDGPMDTFQDSTQTNGFDPNNTSLKVQMRASRSRSLVSTHGSPTDETSHHPLGLVSPLPFEGPSWTPYTMFDVTPGGIPDDSDFGPESGESVPLRQLWARMDDDEGGLEFRDHRFRLRKFTNSVTGTELVDWLMKSDVTGTRAEACAVGQALLDANWVKCVVDDRVFHDAYRLYQRGQQAEMTISERVQYAARAGASDQVQVKTARERRRSLEQVFLADNEPKWVRDISVDEQEDSMSGDRDFWNNVQTSFKRWPSPGEGEVPTSDEESTSSSSQSAQSVSSYLEIDNSQNIIRYKRPRERLGVDGSQHTSSSLMSPTFIDDTLTEISADYLRSYLAWNGTYLNSPWVGNDVGWRENTLHSSHVPNKAKQVFVKLQKVYFRHSMVFLRQLLEAEDLDMTWADIIVPLARRLCDHVIVDADVSMNICHYVHIKKLLDGTPSDCRLVNGVVFSKNVVHSRMKTRVDNPVIMLVATPLEYQRVHYKLSSIDPIVQQESEFFRNLVSRMLRRNPDVVISQCSVSHKARHLLREAGISLVINVKQSVMERLSRCTGADIARSIDQLQTATLGTCSRFRVTRHYNGQRNLRCSDGVKTPVGSPSTSAYKYLMYLDGCNLSQGCTVILRDSPSYESGAPVDQESRRRLARIKEVFLFLVKTMYHGKLEISYLMDQQDIASSFPMAPKKDKKKQIVNSSENVFVKSLSVDSQEVTADDLLRSTSLRAIGASVSSLASDVRTLTPGHSDVESGDELPPASPKSSTPGSPHSSGGSPTEGHVGPQSSAKAKLFVDSLNAVVLSISPLIAPTVPFLLTSEGETSSLRHYLPSTVFWSDLFCNHPELMAGQTWSKCIRYRTESTDKLMDADFEIDMNSFRSRSGTSDSFALPQNMWRTPLHQKSFDSEFATASGAVASGSNLDDLVIPSDPDDHVIPGKDAPDPAVTSRGQHLRARSDVTNASSTTNGFLRMPSQVSSRSYVSKDELRMMSWEKSIMHDVLADVTSTSRASKRRHSPPVTSSPIKQRHGADGFRPAAQNHGDANGRGSFGREEIAWKSVKHKFVSMSISKPAQSREMKDLLADYRACGSSLQPLASGRSPWKPLVTPRTSDAPLSGQPERSWEEEEQSVILCGRSEEHQAPLDCLDPRNHQHIFVLFSSYSVRSPNAPYPCVIPWAVDIDYYHGNDITLGGFLERYCFRPSYHCPSPTCKRPMVEHVRSFVHGTTCMNIVLKELAKPVAVPTILSWCWDPLAQQPTDLKPLSTDAWSMSFAKFLELRLQTFTSSSVHQQPPDTDEDQVIPPFRSFQYFILRDIVAAFKCFEIVVFEVALPPPTLTFDPDTDWRKPLPGSDEGTDDDVTSNTVVTSQYRRFVDEMNVLSKISYEAMDSIHDLIARSRLNNPFDQLIGADQSEADLDITALRQMRESYFDDLALIYQEEKCALRDSVDRLHLEIQSLRTSRLKSVSDDLTESNENFIGVDDYDRECNCEQDGVEISQASRNELLRGLLELACRICNLVQVWNSRITSVSDQDRASRRGSKASSLYYVNQSRKASLLAKTKDGVETKKQLSTLETLQENSNEGEDLETSDPPPNKENNLVDETKEGTRTVDAPAVETIKASQTTLDGNSPSHNKPETKHSGVKRLSRTASSMSMFLVNHLLTSSNQAQIPPPFPLSDHYLLTNCVSSQVVVRDSEPSSIIAYTLRTPEYKLHVISGEDPGSNPTISEGSSTLIPEQASDSSEGVLEGADRRDPYHVEFKGTAQPRDVVPGGPNQNLARPSSPNLNSNPHYEVQFGDTTTKFYCKVYFTHGFKNLRSQILTCSEDDYVTSLSRCVRWVARGGKSGSAFHKTLDDRLVLKQMSRFDLHSFLELAPSYFEYISNSLETNSPTALSKILGVYRVSFSNTATNQSFKQDILVMENLFYRRHILQVFDLKGSVRNRHVKTEAGSHSYSTSPKVLSDSSLSSLAPDSNSSSTTNRSNQVLLDENLLTIMRDNPLYVHAHTKMLIKSALTDDAHFLSQHGIIDYSLLVGIDDERKEIVVGIIDYMRTFTWDKKLEHLVKSSIGMGKRGARSMPTVVSPEMYRSRFCEAMDRYFQVVPDRWFEMHAYPDKPCD